MAYTSFGPAKYDDICTVARLASGAQSCILIVIEGNKGTSFSIQATAQVSLMMPAALRSMANEIEKQNKATLRRAGRRPPDQRS